MKQTILTLSVGGLPVGFRLSHLREINELPEITPVPHAAFDVIGIVVVDDAEIAVSPLGPQSGLRGATAEMTASDGAIVSVVDIRHLLI